MLFMRTNVHFNIFQPKASLVKLNFFTHYISLSYYIYIVSGNSKKSAINPLKWLIHLTNYGLSIINDKILGKKEENQAKLDKTTKV